MGLELSPLRVPAEDVKRLSEQQARRREALLQALRDREVPTSGGLEFVRASADLVDELVLELRRVARSRVLDRLGRKAAERSDRVAIVALGGYGRRELCPHSDIDLLFLLPERTGERPERDGSDALIEAVLYGLWDLRFEVGHAIRTVSECIEVGEADLAARTSMLEARLVESAAAPAGDEERANFRALQEALERTLFARGKVEAFIEDKLQEAAQLSARYGNSVYLLEPEVKLGDGGLRALHTALWIARARFHMPGIRELLVGGVLSSREARSWERAYNFLLRVRTEIHLAARRRRDALGFDLQESIALVLGYGRPGRLDPRGRKHATERFMRAYYFHAHQNRRVAQLVVERATSHARGRPSPMRTLPSRFKTFEERITVLDREQLRRDPTSLMRIFRVAAEEKRELYSYTKDLIVEALMGLDARVRRDPQVAEDFLRVLEDPSDDGRTVELMHELGVLRRMIPEFGRITARWQHSLYHVYTVDIHSLFVLRELKKLRRGDYGHEQPALTHLMADVPRPEVLYLAGLLHDVGKGWDRGSHSVRGEKVARVVGARLEAAGSSRWSARETEDVAWLVREHLTMSDTSQRRDLSDPKLIEDFAGSCRTEERMTMLYLLTFADMRATSPKVWNDWKASLLAEMYGKGREALTREARAVTGEVMEVRRQVARAEIAAALAEERAAVAEESVEAFARAMPPRYLLSVAPRRMSAHFQAWRQAVEGDGFSVSVRLTDKDVSELTVVSLDRPGLLALLAGTVAAHRFEILSAEIYSVDGSSDGKSYALDMLSLRDVSQAPSDPERFAALKRDLRRVLVEDQSLESLFGARGRGSGLEQRPRPPVETKVVVLPEASERETVVDVFCQDHLGALATIARAFAEQGLSIRLAKISTQGDRVADGFYVTDARTGQKLEGEERLRRLERALVEAIERSLAGSRPPAP